MRSAESRAGLRHPGLRAALAGAAGIVPGVLLLPPLEAAFAAAFWCLALVVVRSDLARFIIPDEASAAIAGLGLLRALAGPATEAGWLADALPAAASALLAGAGAFAVFWLVAAGFRRLSGREGLGFGDVKLAGAIGIWLTPADQAVALEIAALAALGLTLVLHRGRARRGIAIPFGAFLAPAAWLVLVSGPAVQALLDRTS